MAKKYEVNSSEGEFQAGSDTKVLKNLLGITTEAEINEVESLLLVQLYEYLFDNSMLGYRVLIPSTKTGH